jgi:cytidine deaminase
MDLITPGFLGEISRVFYEAYRYSIHAEKMAIMSVKNKNILKYCKIFIIKITKDGNIEQAIPCCNCTHLLKKYKIYQVQRIN